MSFLDELQDTLAEYCNEDLGVQDNAKLYGMNKLPNGHAEHIIFQPMPNAVMSQMVQNYTLSFPEELLDVYRFMNGADLFRVVHIVPKINLTIPFSRLSIYGIPMTADRKHLEPYNISIEDLRRPDGTPEEWLKFASCYPNKDLHMRNDLFIDTQSHKVFAVDSASESCAILSSWDCLDNCLCDLLVLLKEQG